MTVLGYIITLGTKPLHYLGFRGATADMETHENEQFIESLEGWTLEIPPPPPSKQTVTLGYQQWKANQSPSVLLALVAPMALLDDGFKSWLENSIAYTSTELTDTISYIQTIAGVPVDDLERLKQNVLAVDPPKGV